jgi:hypothetical protein
MITRRQVLLGSALFPLATTPPRRSNVGGMSTLLQFPEAPKMAAAPPERLKVAIMSKSQV